MVYVLYMTSPESLEAAGFVQVFQRAAPAAYLDRLSLEHGLTVRRGIYRDRKSTRLNSSHRCISYAVFCLKKKKKTNSRIQSLAYNAHPSEYRAYVQPH